MLHPRECLVKYAANIFTQLQVLIAVFRSQEQTVDMLSRTLKLARYPMAYPIGYLKNGLLCVLGALDPILFFIPDWLPSILFQILPSETKSAS